MNANYIYDIFETSTAHNVDLNIALSILKGKQKIPDGMTEQGIREFVGVHYDPLWRAYQTGNRKLFADILTVCEKSNDHEADVLFRAHETGNLKLIADMEAKYGIGGATNV